MKYTIIIFLLLRSSLLMAQKENAAILEGNQKYNEKDFSGAQKSYNDALTTNPESDAGNFNMGNSLFQQQDYEGALNQFRKTAESTDDPEVRAQAYHNMGNTLLQQKKYEESINAYKQALRNNPEDPDTKYNLAYAQKMIQQQQNKNQDQKKEEQKKEEEKKEESQDQNKEQQPPKDPEQKQSQPKQYSKEELERIMQALNEDDKNVQEKVNKQKVQSAGAEAEKDW